jgi:hypothetical protein
MTTRDGPRRDELYKRRRGSVGMALLLTSGSIGSALVALVLIGSSCSSPSAYVGSIVLIFAAEVQAALILACPAPRLSVRVLVTIATSGLAVFVCFGLFITQSLCGLNDSDLCFMC